jgi:hypothetical protein
MLQYGVMENLLRDFTSYMREVLGISALPELWRGSDHVPVFLCETYHFSQFNLLETPCLLMQDRAERQVNPLSIVKHMRQVRQYWEGAVIYLCASVSAYARKRLIEQQVSFVVPGNQLFLPPLGVDLREHYQQLHPTVQVFSPSTQAVILYALRHGREQPFTPSGLAKRLGYTRMTMARAFDDLQAAEVGEIVPQGKERLFMANGTRALWEQTRTRMRTPVKKRLWSLRPLAEWPSVPAGLTALASYSMLVAPDRPVYAMSAMDWKGMKQQGLGIEFEFPEQDENSCELELWSYSPCLFADHDRVDPFSLYLSLQHESDERIQSALEQMMEQMTW